MSEQLRLLAVHAHPDDEATKGAATIAHYAAQGVDVLVATCTGGERGEILNPRLRDDPDIVGDIDKIRRREMAAAREILGVRQEWLGFTDSGWPRGEPPPPLPAGCFALQPLEDAAEPLVRLVRSFRPHVMVTYDENGGYPHPDHIMCHKVSVVAFDVAAKADHYPDAGPPWQPLKLYYSQTPSRGRTAAVHEALLEAGLESPYGQWLEVWKTRPDRPITTSVRCGDSFPARDAAMRAHATQFDFDGAWFACPVELEQKVWPTEEFELARCHVDAEPPENDLFAGIRGR
jgi:mycothiol S-conjugate amidase